MANLAAEMYSAIAGPIYDKSEPYSFRNPSNSEDIPSVRVYSKAVFWLKGTQSEFMRAMLYEIIIIKAEYSPLER